MADPKKESKPISRKRKRKYFYIKILNVTTGEVHGRVVSDFWLEKLEDQIHAAGNEISTMFPIVR